jgi:excisionase family DNA binding protein
MKLAKCGAPGVAAARQLAGSAVASEMLTIGKLAELLDCSERSIYRLLEAGDLPRPIKLGRLVRWWRKQIMAWLESRSAA